MKYAPPTIFAPARRRFTVGVLASGLAACLAPLRALAEWPKALFTQTDFDATVAELTQGRKVKKHAMLKAPKIAENGGQVRVGVTAPEGGVAKISLIVEKNPVPLTSQFLLGEHSVPEVGINLKVRETSRIIALADAGDTVYRDEVSVQVSAGGCG